MSELDKFHMIPVVRYFILLSDPSDPLHILLLLLGSCRQKESFELEEEVKKLRLEFSDLHLKHKSLARELRRHQDVDTKSKAEIKRLKGSFLICFMSVIYLLKLIDHLGSGLTCLPLPT